MQTLTMKYNHIVQSANYQGLIQALVPCELYELYSEALTLGRLDVCQYLQLMPTFKVGLNQIVQTIQTHNPILIPLFKNNDIEFEVINQLSDIDVDYLLQYIIDIGLTDTQLLSYSQLRIANPYTSYIYPRPINQKQASFDRASKFYLAIPKGIRQPISKTEQGHVLRSIKRLYKQLHKELPSLPMIFMP